MRQKLGLVAVKAIKITSAVEVLSPTSQFKFTSATVKRFSKKYKVSITRDNLQQKYRQKKTTTVSLALPSNNS